MKKYIKANSFSTKEDIRNAIKKVFNGYIQKEEYYAQGTQQYVFKLKGNGLSLVAGGVNTSYRSPGGLYPSTQADRFPCVFEILDNEQNMPLLYAFKDAGFKEACGYKNSQWGSYKIIISTYDRLVRADWTYESFLDGEYV